MKRTAQNRKENNKDLERMKADKRESAIPIETLQENVPNTIKKNVWKKNENKVHFGLFDCALN